MRITKLIALLLALSLVAALCACGNTGEDTPDTQPSTTEATTDEKPTETTEATIPEGKAVYTVTVQDEGGNPVSGAMVQLCLEACIPSVTNEEGVATYTVDVADYKVSFVSMPQGYTCDESEFYFDAGSYEMTITLKAVA